MSLVRVRASSLPELFDCPARWEAKHLHGIRLPGSGAAQLGTAVHNGSAAYDSARMKGLSAAEALERAEAALVDAIRHPRREVVWGELAAEQAEAIALALLRRYASEVSPKYRFAAVELTCPAIDMPELGLSLTGTADRVYVDADSGALGVADVKTGRNAVAADGTVSTAGHALQLAAYEMLAARALGRDMEAPAHVIGLSVAKTASARRTGVGVVRGARELLSSSGGRGMLRHASAMLASGDFYGNARSQLCREKSCPIFQKCRFRK